MNQSVEQIQKSRQAEDNLEPYRRLVELQKQMIHLVRQYEKTKRECTDLWEKMNVKPTKPIRSQGRNSVRQRVFQQAKIIFKSWPLTSEKTEAAFAGRNTATNPQREIS